MSEAVKRYCMRAFGSIVQPIEVPYSGTWVPSADHDRIVAELKAENKRLLGYEDLAILGEAKALEECDTLRAEVERLRKDAERLTWLIDEEARIHGYLAQHGLRFGLVWPNGDQQADLFACPREAIDAALEASR